MPIVREQILNQGLQHPAASAPYRYIEEIQATLASLFNCPTARHHSGLAFSIYINTMAACMRFTQRVGTIVEQVIFAIHTFVFSRFGSLS